MNVEQQVISLRDCGTLWNNTIIIKRKDTRSDHYFDQHCSIEISSRERLLYFRFNALTGEKN
jgi:hypothetical protein